MIPLFRTPIQIPKTDPIPLDQPWLLLGSCFSEEIGQRLKKSGLTISSNPSGILFNPLSILNTLTGIMEAKAYNHDSVREHNSIYFSWEHHGSFKSRDRDALLESMNSNQERSIKTFKKNPVIVMTWGSSIVYRLKENGKVVANCHKHPASSFDRTMLEVDDIVNAYKPVIEKLIVMHPDFRLIFTVSPVRYAKDGFVENQLSKSILIIALNKLINLYPKNIDYFPAYEVVMDELRDYRFYGRDMIHPGSEAIDMVWEYFKETYFAETSMKILAEVEAYNKMKDHKPLFPESKETAKLDLKIENIKIELLKNYSFLNL